MEEQPRVMIKIEGEEEDASAIARALRDMPVSASERDVVSRLMRRVRPERPETFAGVVINKLDVAEQASAAAAAEERRKIAESASMAAREEQTREEAREHWQEEQQRLREATRRDELLREVLARELPRVLAELQADAERQRQEDARRAAEAAAAARDRTCARCGSQYSEAENAHGACRWHTTEACAATLERMRVPACVGAPGDAWPQRPDAIDRNMLCPLLVHGTSFCRGALVHNCCGRPVLPGDSNRNGCWVGVHSEDGPGPDIGPRPTAWEPCSLTRNTAALSAEEEYVVNLMYGAAQFSDGQWQFYAKDPPRLVADCDMGIQSDAVARLREQALACRRAAEGRLPPPPEEKREEPAKPKKKEEPPKPKKKEEPPKPEKKKEPAEPPAAERELEQPDTTWGDDAPTPPPPLEKLDRPGITHHRHETPGKGLIQQITPRVEAETGTNGWITSAKEWLEDAKSKANGDRVSDAFHGPEHLRRYLALLTKIDSVIARLESQRVRLVGQKEKNLPSLVDDLDAQDARGVTLADQKIIADEALEQSIRLYNRDVLDVAQDWQIVMDGDPVLTASSKPGEWFTAIDAIKSMDASGNIPETDVELSDVLESLKRNPVLLQAFGIIYKVMPIKQLERVGNFAIKVLDLRGLLGGASLEEYDAKIIKNLVDVFNAQEGRHPMEAWSKIDLAARKLIPKLKRYAHDTDCSLALYGKV